MSHTLSGSHLIEGQWKRSSSDASFTAFNPASGDMLAPVFSEAGEAEVNAALAAASMAFEESHELAHGWQANLLDAVAAKIMDLGDSLLERAEQETALPRARLMGERARTCNQLKMFAELVREGSWVDATIDSAEANRAPIPKPDIRRMHKPRGPVVVFGASNFPFAFSVCGGDTASALAAGCPVVAKGHPSHPGTSELFGAAVLEALKELQLPLGLFAMLQGRANELGAALVKHPSTTAVGFTGSNRAGRALFDLASARPVPIPVYAEMGSLNPLVVLPAALKERSEVIAKGLAGSVLLGGGQFCTKPGVILMLGDATHFVAELARNIAATPRVTMLNSGLCASFMKRIGDWPHLAGVKVHVAPGRPAGPGASVSPGLFETTADFFVHQADLREEAFGPAALVVRCDDELDIKHCLQSIGGSLTGTMHAGAREDNELLARVSRLLESIVGRVIVNGYPTGVEVNSAIVHSGPYPATTNPGFTSVGTAAITRFTRLIAYQDAPQSILPPELKSENPLGILRRINGTLTRDPISTTKTSS
jgi:NADP-dependent aldehyde dehydrogenase